MDSPALSNDPSILAKERTHSKALNFIRVNSIDIERQATEQSRDSSSDADRGSSFRKEILKTKKPLNERVSGEPSPLGTDLSYEEFRYLPVNRPLNP